MRRTVSLACLAVTGCAVSYVDLVPIPSDPPAETESTDASDELPVETGWTDPTDPTDPTDATEPTDPTDPTDDTDPACPVLLVPVMTGPTTPSGEAEASGNYSASYPAWQAFDAPDLRMGQLWLSELWVSPAWVSYTFDGGAQAVHRYGIGYGNGPSLTTRAPKRWEFQAFTGGQWVTLDSQTAQTGWTSGEVRWFTLPSPQAYASYRLLIHEDNDSRDLIVTASVAELFLDGCTP